MDIFRNRITNILAHMIDIFTISLSSIRSESQDANGINKIVTDLNNQLRFLKKIIPLITRKNIQIQNKEELTQTILYVVGGKELLLNTITDRILKIQYLKNEFGSSSLKKSA